VAQRRVPALLAAGADVLLVAPEVTPTLEDLAARGRIRWERRPYEPADLHEAWLVQACTKDGKVNAEVAADAQARRIWCVRADDALAAAAWTPASGRVGEITVGVHAGGDPRRAAGIRDAIVAGLQSGDLESRHSRAKPSGVALVGGGPGDPGLITVRGRHLLAQADVVIADRLAPRELLDELGPDVEIIDAAKIPYGHTAGHAAGHTAERNSGHTIGDTTGHAADRPAGRGVSQERINELLVEHARRGRFVVRLKGGDPYIFGRGAEEVLHCARAGVPVTVVPGVTSAVAAPAAAGIPLTHRGLAQEFHVVSAHVPPGDARSTVDWPALGRSTGTLVLLMAVEHMGEIARSLLRYGRLPDTPVAVIQDGTLRAQRVLTATLETVADEMTAHEMRPPATVVVGDVVLVAREVEMLSANMGRQR
jgi:uroporphyrin-III C-methyltransferase/precorrin-2 dehydrogenase/sirohydrochlorin ferrochelatase